MKIEYINKRPTYAKAVVSVLDHVECRCQPVSRPPVPRKKSSRRQHSHQHRNQTLSQEHGQGKVQCQCYCTCSLCCLRDARTALSAQLGFANYIVAQNNGKTKPVFVLCIQTLKLAHFMTTFSMMSFKQSSSCFNVRLRLYTILIKV